MFPWIDFSLLRGNRDRISAIGGTYVRAPFSFLSFESVTVDTVVVVQWKSAFGEEKDVIFFLVRLSILQWELVGVGVRGAWLAKTGREMEGSSGGPK